MINVSQSERGQGISIVFRAFLFLAPLTARKEGVSVPNEMPRRTERDNGGRFRCEGPSPPCRPQASRMLLRLVKKTIFKKSQHKKHTNSPQNYHKDLVNGSLPIHPFDSKAG